MFRRNLPSFGRSSSWQEGKIISCALNLVSRLFEEVRLPSPPISFFHTADALIFLFLSGFAEEVDKRAPITIKFEIPYFTVSGIQVRYLKIVEKSGYQALPWVRYITQHGDDVSLLSF